MRTWQQRLAMKQDNIRRKLIDLQIEHMGAPTDAIRLRLTRNDEGDVKTTVIALADVIPVVFPPLEDIPYRRIGGNIENGFTINSLVNAAAEENKENYQIYVPHGVYLVPDDLIIRVMLDPIDTPNHPSIFCLQVTEALGTFGGAMIIRSKYNTTLYNQDLSSDTLAIIAKMAERRLKLGY